MSFAVVAAARPVAFFLLEASFNLTFLVLVWVGLPIFGLWAVGLAFVIGYGVYFLVALCHVRRLTGFRFERLSARLLILTAAAAAPVLALARLDPMNGAVLASVLALAAAVIGSRIVLVAVGPEGRLPASAYAFYARAGWPIR